MNAMVEEPRSRSRDPLAERREREGFAILERTYALVEGRIGAPVAGLRVSAGLGLTREQLFRGIQYLALRDYLDYVGAGPLVALTGKGAQYVENGARRRRSVR